MPTSKINLRLRAMYENSIDAILETIPDGRVLAANPAACRLLGYTEKEICTLGRQGLLDTSDPRCHIALKIREETGSFTGELTMIARDGRRFPVHLSTSVYELGKGGERRSVIIFRDISRRMHLENMIKEREAYLRSILENTDGSIWTIDKEFRLIEFNSAFKNRFFRGTGRNIKKGEDVSLSVPERIREKWIKYYKKGLSGKKFTIQTATVPPLELEYFKYNFNPITASDGTVTGLTIMGNRVTDLVISQKELKGKTRELHKLTKHLVNEREKELRHTANDLHDDLGQKLTALKMNIAWLRPRIGVQAAAVNNKFTEINKLIEEAVGTINRVVQGLRPAMLDDLGLKAAIEWQAEEFRNKSGISVSLHFDPSEIKVVNELSIAVFRIVQESLTNILRHADASHVSIRLTVKKILKIEITDNGRGISNEHISRPDSLGIAGMSERARSLGGRLKISARKGGGTVVSASFRTKKNI